MIFLQDYSSSIVPADDLPGAGFDIAIDAEGNQVTGWCDTSGHVTVTRPTTEQAETTQAL